MKPPEYLQLEITTKCNAKCIMCTHVDGNIPPMDMPVGEIFKILDEAYAWGVKTIGLHHVGEPTLHPNYPKIVEEMVRRYPNWKLKEYTNGSMLLNEGRRKSLLLLDEVVISIDGASTKTMKIIRPGLDPGKIIRGFAKLLEARGNGKSPRITIARVELDENSHESYDDFKRFWKGADDYASRKGRHVNSTYWDSKPIQKPRKNVACDRLWRTMAVRVNGDVIICCSDYSSEVIIGNVHEKSLKEVWSSTKMQKLRELHETGRANTIPICKKCTWVN